MKKDCHIPIRPDDWVIERIVKHMEFIADKGIIVYKQTPNARLKVGAEVGALSGDYKAVYFKNSATKQRRAVKYHHIVWFLVTGQWPTLCVDHVNRNGLDNRWENLREVSSSQSMMNRGIQSNNKSGVTGVSFCSDNNKWTVRISLPNGKPKHLGYFNSIEEAKSVRLDARAKYYGVYSPGDVL